MEHFNPINALIESTGAMINSSKKRFSWRFELDSSEHSVELECSFITNKRRVTFDGVLIYKGTKSIGKDFQYRFNHIKHILTVENHRTDANLLVDGFSFDEIYSRRMWDRTFIKKNNPNTIENIKEPKPAKVLSEEEYSNAVKIEGANNEQHKQKSLHDILYKDKPKTINKPMKIC